MYKSILLTLALVVSCNAYCKEVEDILSKGEAPSGVVFEIVSGDRQLLKNILPDIREDIFKLKKIFPHLPIAIVSHGKEQFMLTKANLDKEPQVRSAVLELVADNVDVHVCETYAGWYRVAAEDFPDYVNVAAEGPAQIEHYEELGYIVITLP